MVYLPPFSAVLWFICLHSLQFCGLHASIFCSSVDYLPQFSAVLWFIILRFFFFQLCGLLASRLCSSSVVWPPTSTVLWFIGLQTLQNQQTREIISAGKTSHKHNNKDLIRPSGNLTWHASKYKVLKLHQRYTQSLQFCGLLACTPWHSVYSSPVSPVLWFTDLHSVSSVVYWPPLDAVLWSVYLRFLHFCGLLVFTLCSSVVYWLHSMQFCGLLAFTPCSYVVYWPPLSAVL